MRILLVDDSHKTRTSLMRDLVDSGFSVDIAGNAIDGRHMALTEQYDLAILDIEMPGRDGWQVLRAIRAAGKEMPVLYLTGQCSVAERVKGLELGADGYLVKPFAFPELLARVGALLRRGPKRISPGCLAVADLELDLMRRRASRAGGRIHLTAKEFLLLELLLRRQGEVLPRALIMSHVWGIDFDCDTNVLDLAIWRLRAKVDRAFAPKLIHTVRGIGYVLKADDAE